MSHLLSKLVVVNTLVILLVILLAGLSVKDYACFLVNSENVAGQELVETLNGFLWKAGLLSFLIAGLFHFYTVKQIIRPIRCLSIATKEIKKGKVPSKINILTSGELKELIENFNSMSETLLNVQEQREEMLRDIAHELRTPLTNINGYLEALQNKVIDGNPELFGSLLEESRRITRIVELITELNSWNNSTYPFEKTFYTLDINSVLKDSLQAFNLKIQHQFEDVFFSIGEATIIGNNDGVMQVFTNILQNILDYNTGTDLEVTGTKNNGKYLITFTHTGQYINPEKKDLIFERFYRIEESRSTRSTGAGLGLAIAKNIIEAHNGSMGLTTNGTRHSFWINFPL